MTKEDVERIFNLASKCPYMKRVSSPAFYEEYPQRLVITCLASYDIIDNEGDSIRGDLINFILFYFETYARTVVNNKILFKVKIGGFERSPGGHFRRGRIEQPFTVEIKDNDTGEYK